MASLLVALVALAPAAGGGELFVSANADARAPADGTRERPFRSLTAALEAARRGGAARIRLDLGRYDAAGGERFPLELPPALELLGAGSSGCTLDGGGTALIASASGAGERALAGLTLANAARGLLATAPAGADARLGLALRDVALLGLGTGLDLELGESAARPGTLALAADGLRASDCTTGLGARGVGALELALDGSLFERCDVGLLLEADPGEDATRIGQRDAPRTLRVRHALALERTSFLACRQAGFRRRGADGRNDGPPYRFVECLFQANDAGIEFVRPCADSEFSIERSRFLQNRPAAPRAPPRCRGPPPARPRGPGHWPIPRRLERLELPRGAHAALPGSCRTSEQRTSRAADGALSLAAGPRCSRPAGVQAATQASQDETAAARTREEGMRFGYSRAHGAGAGQGAERPAHAGAALRDRGRREG